MINNLDDKILYAILNFLKTNKGKVIRTFLRDIYNIQDKDLAELYQIKLEQEGLVRLTLVGSDNTKVAQLTDKGKLLLGTWNPEILSEKITSEVIQKKEIISEKKSNSFIISNRNKIDEALNFLYSIQDKLENNEILMPGDVRSCSNNIDVIFRKVFLPDHEIFKESVKGSADKRKVLEVITNAIAHLEFELLDSHSDFSNIHPIIREASEKQFLNTHYREAVLNSFSRLIEEIKDKYPISDKAGKLKDGVDLMQDIFSKDNPKLSFSNDPNERQGIMFLFSGAVGAIRNKYAHKTKEIEDKDFAFELINFASALMRLFENPNLY